MTKQEVLKKFFWGNWRLKLPQYFPKMRAKQKRFRVKYSKPLVSLVPERGLEPLRPCERRILSPLRLPFRHSGAEHPNIL